MDSTNLYKKETGKSPTTLINGQNYFTWDYIVWLKKRASKLKTDLG